MKGDNIDFSPLDPSRDRARWNDMIASLARRAHQARQRRLTVAAQLMAWSRPMLAAAAGVAMVTWIGAMASDGPKEANHAAVPEPAMSLAGWAATDEVPATQEILQLLGAPHAAR